MKTLKAIDSALAKIAATAGIVTQDVMYAVTRTILRRTHGDQYAEFFRSHPRMQNLIREWYADFGYFGSLKEVFTCSEDFRHYVQDCIEVGQEVAQERLTKLNNSGFTN